MDRYKSAWQGAAEGINSGIDNAIKLYSARNAQEDQAYKQTLRQREEAEYAEKMKPLGTVGDVVSRYEEGPESRKIMLTTIRTVLGKGENDPLLRHEGEKIMGVLGVDQKKALFDSTGKDVANKIKTMTDAYSKMDKNAPEALATKQEIDSLNQRHLAYTTESRKYQREIDEELRKQAEEKRKEEIHPLEQKKLTAEIGKLNALAAQARARGSAEGGLTPAQRLSDQRAQINSIQAQADDARAIIVAQLKEETDPQMRKMLNDGLGKIPGHVRAATEAIRRGNDYTGLQEFNTWLANPRGYRAAAPAKVPVAQGSGSSGLVKKYNSPEEVMAALKNTDASTAVQILRANNMTVDDLRKTGQPKTPSPKTQEAAKQKRPHEMTPEELKKADVEYWNKWKTAAGRVSPIAPKSPSEQAAEFNKAVEYNRQLAERAKKRNLFGQR